MGNDYSREMLLSLLDRCGFARMYNFIYVPMDFKRRAGLGYAFLDFTDNAAATEVLACLQGFTHWAPIHSSKVMQIVWGEPMQGFLLHVERFRNSPVMAEHVPDEF